MNKGCPNYPNPNVELYGRMQGYNSDGSCGAWWRRRLPILAWLPTYTTADLISDSVAGVTVGLTLIPQVIAYAALAGLGPQYGLYSGLVGGFVYVFLGSTRELCVGPTALVCLLTFTYTQDTNIDMVILLTFLSGCIELLCGIFQLGFLVEFVSVPVVSGFTSAAAVIIASSQAKGLFGLHYKSNNFVSTWLQFYQHVQSTLLCDLALGSICILTLLLLRKIKDIPLESGKPSITSSSWPSRILWFIMTGRNALVVLACIALSYYLEQYQGITPFTLTAQIESGLPGLVVPPTSTVINGQLLDLSEMILHLGSGLAVIPLVSIISNIAIAKAFSNGQCVDATQEILALGVCNMLGACVYSLPVAGSFTRSAVNAASGVRTQLRGVITSLVVVLALVFITPYFHYIPRTALAAVVMCAVLFMVEVELLKPMWATNRRDLVPALSTFLACLALGVELGLGVGVIVDVCFLLYYNARPDITIQQETVHDTDIVYWHVLPRGSLLFPAVDHIRQTIVAKAQSHTEDGVRVRAVVLDCALVNRADFSAAQGLQGVLEDVRSVGVPLVIMNADPEVARSLTGLCADIKLAYNQQQLLQILQQQAGRIFYCRAHFKSVLWQNEQSYPSQMKKAGRPMSRRKAWHRAGHAPFTPRHINRKRNTDYQQEEEW